MARSLIEHEAIRASSPRIQNTRLQSSRKQWLKDLDTLRLDAGRMYGDAAWAHSETGEILYAHKALLYARSTSAFLSKYLQGYQQHLPPSVSTSSLSLAPDDYSSRSASPGSLISTVNTQRPLSLSSADWALLETVLEYLYTSSNMSESYEFFFAPARQSDADAPVDRMQHDLLFMWRAKLFADAQIQITPSTDVEISMASESIFTVHRAILCARIPYFRALLLSPYADSDNRLFALPSPPFTNASLHFTLGYAYTGTLSFANRTFDLSTSLAIWRSAAYLNMPDLLQEVEAIIQDLSVNLAKPDPVKCARVLQFALCPDVDTAIGDACRAVVTSPLHFGSAWKEEVGNMDQSVQQSLVNEVCINAAPQVAVETLRQLLRCRSALPVHWVAWSEHVKAMLVPVEARLARLFARETADVVASRGFVVLLEGRTFSSDVLETALDLVVQGLGESSAPSAYQVLVGNVLLREDGIPMDARSSIEDCRKNIITYLQKRWMGCRSIDAFEGLEPWACKEIADELELTPADLIRSDSVPATITTKTGLRVAAKKTDANIAQPMNTQDMTTLNHNIGRVAKARISASSDARPPSSPILSSFNVPHRQRAASAASSSFTNRTGASNRAGSSTLTERKTVARHQITAQTAPSVTSNAARFSTVSVSESRPASIKSQSATSVVRVPRVSAATVRLQNSGSKPNMRTVDLPSAVPTSIASKNTFARPRAVSSTSVRSASSSKTLQSGTSPAASIRSKTGRGALAQIRSTSRAVGTIPPALPKSLRHSESTRSVMKPSNTDGTTLLEGIPCILTLPDHKAKAKVFYLGPVASLGDGQWIGCQLDSDQEISFSTSASVRPSSGVLDGIAYFKASAVDGAFVRPALVMFLF